MFEWLIKFFSKRKIDFFIKRKTEDIENMLREIFIKKKAGVLDLSPETKIFCVDPMVYLCKKKAMEGYLADDLTDMRLYKKDTYDCDDFALHLWSKVKKDYPLVCFGYVLSSAHAFNIFIDDDMNIWFIEPQSDKFLTLEQIQKNKLYKSIRLIII